MKYIGIYSIPTIIAITAICILIKKDSLFDEFTKGCREGIATSFKLIPNLVILICAVKMFSASGALDIICDSLGSLIGGTLFPKELIPILITRPISGSAATAMINNLFAESDPDSFVGRCASVIMGSSDTIVYTIAMYFGTSGIKNLRYTLPASFAVFMFCTLISVTVTKIFWGY